MYAHGLGDVIPAGLSYESWLGYHPEFLSKVLGYTSGGTPIYGGVPSNIEQAKTLAWSAYTVGPYNPSNKLANNVGDVPAFAGALVLPSVAQPPASVQSTGGGTQQVSPKASSQTVNAPAQSQATQTQAGGGTTATADTSIFGLSGMEIMIGILGLGVALMSMGKGKR